MLAPTWSPLWVSVLKPKQSNTKDIFKNSQGTALSPGKGGRACFFPHSNTPLWFQNVFYSQNEPPDLHLVPQNVQACTFKPSNWERFFFFSETSNSCLQILQLALSRKVCDKFGCQTLGLTWMANLTNWDVELFPYGKLFSPSLPHHLHKHTRSSSPGWNV